jgi:drug/metabolite transporter (DMT)-like permease
VEQSRPLVAAGFMLGAIVSFSAMAVAGREASAQLDTFEIMTYRSLIGLILVLILSRSFGTFTQIGRTDMSLHFIRNISHFAGQNLWFFALAIIPFAQLFAFEFSVPIWVALAAPFFLAEKLTRIRIVSVVLGFVGILIVARPGMLPINAGVIAAALCSIAFAATMITTKLLTRTNTITNILFWLTAMQLCFGVLFAGYDFDITLPTSDNIHWVVIIGLAGLLAHFSITKAISYAPATIVTPMDFARLPIIAFIGATFYSEPIDLFVIVGSIIIFGANYTNIYAEAKSKIRT